MIPFFNLNVHNFHLQNEIEVEIQFSFINLNHLTDALDNEFDLFNIFFRCFVVVV